MRFDQGRSAQLLPGDCDGRGAVSGGSAAGVASACGWTWGEGVFSAGVADGAEVVAAGPGGAQRWADAGLPSGERLAEHVVVRQFRVHRTDAVEFAGDVAGAAGLSGDGPGSGR